MFSLTLNRSIYTHIYIDVESVWFKHHDHSVLVHNLFYVEVATVQHREWIGVEEERWRLCVKPVSKERKTQSTSRCWRKRIRGITKVWKYSVVDTRTTTTRGESKTSDCLVGTNQTNAATSIWVREYYQESGNRFSLCVIGCINLIPRLYTTHTKGDKRVAWSLIACESNRKETEGRQ